MLHDIVGCSVLAESRQRAWGNLLLLTYVIYALIAAAFLTINVPPFQNPDETNHLLRADNISRGYFMGHRFGSTDAGGVASPEIDLSGRPFDAPKFHPEMKVRQAMYAASFYKFNDQGKDITFRNTAIYPPFLYAPSVVAVWVGKAGRMSVIQTLYLSRILTAMTTILLVGIALRVCVTPGLGGAGLFIFVLATLPMSLSLQSACSQDGPMLGLAALAAALLARSRVTRQSTGIVAVVVALALIAAARPAYLFLALLPLAFRAGLRARIVAVCVAGLAVVAWTLAANHYATTGMVERGADIGAQLRVMLSPVHDLELLYRTLDVIGRQYLDQIVGQLGWLDVVLPRWYIDVALGVIALSALASLDLKTRGALIIAGAVVVSALSVFALIYLSWDPVGAPLIEGVQGRYFLPLLLILGSLGTVPLRPGGRVVWLMAAAFPVLSIGITMRAIILRYYLVS